MKLCKVKDYKDLSRKAANIIQAQVILKPDCVLGLATGSSPVGIYEILIERHQNGDLDFSEVSTINLDEYKGLRPEADSPFYIMRNDVLVSFVISAIMRPGLRSWLHLHIVWDDLAVPIIESSGLCINNSWDDVMAVSFDTFLVAKSSGKVIGIRQ